MKITLTDKALKAIKPAPAGKRIVLWDSGLSGFGLRVTDRGALSFHVMRRLPGKATPVRVALRSPSAEYAPFLVALMAR